MGRGRERKERGKIRKIRDEGERKGGRKGQRKGQRKGRREKGEGIIEEGREGNSGQEGK